MAGSSLLTLIDDIASVLDDIAAMTKVAAKKTAGVLGDDLALNAEQVSGVRAERELPVVWAVAKGSAKNKLILVPAALAISAALPWAVTPLLMIGGAFLCFEGFEKVAHKFLHSESKTAVQPEVKLRALLDPKIDLVALEKKKIKGAIRTDFILSAEIIVIALGTVQDAPLASQLAVITAISAIMTIGVYGLVSGIVKLDDLGTYLVQKPTEEAPSRLKLKLGRSILVFAPYLMKTLSIAGTAAMFLVGGGILVHGIPGAEHLVHGIEESIRPLPALGASLAYLAPIAVNALTGIMFGGVAVLVYNLAQKALALLQHRA